MKKYPNLIQYLNSFGGGVILAVGMIHLMGEGVRTMEEACGGEGCEVEYAFIIMIVSYCAMLLCMNVLTHHEHSPQGEQAVPAASEGGQNNVAPLEIEGATLDPSSPTKVKLNAEQIQAEAVGFLTFFSISVHEILLGLALGISTELSGIIGIAIGIIAHTWADTLALAFVLARKKMLCMKPWIWIPLQAAVTSVGVVIGMFVSDTENVLLESIFLCITAGSFLFFFANDIAVEVLRGKKRATNFAFVLAGICLLTLAVSLAKVYGGGHDHSHEEEEVPGEEHDH